MVRLREVKRFGRGLEKSRVGTYAAAAAFFLFLALAPLAITVSLLLPFTPVTADETLSSVRKNTPPRSSSLSTKRPMGVPLRILAERAVGVPSGLKSRDRFWLEIRKPGAMALARMPVPAKWVASHWVKLLTAALAPE